MHYVVPPAYVLFWLLFVPKGRLALSDAAWVLILPILNAFMSSCTARGRASTLSFVDVPRDRHGADRVKPNWQRRDSTMIRYDMPFANFEIDR